MLAAAAANEDLSDDEIQEKARNMIAPQLVPGDHVQTHPGERQAFVMFVGQIPGMPAGYWVGVQYEEKVGKNDGTINGKRYFTCPPGHGGFLRSSKVTPLSEMNERAARQKAAEELAEATKLARRSHVKPEKEKKRDKEGRTSPGVSFDAAQSDVETHERSDSPPMSANRGRRASLVAWMHTPSAAHSARGSPRRQRPPGATHPYRCLVTGSGISSAVVGSLAQFTLTSYDETGKRVTFGGDNYTVTMRGQGGLPNSQPAVVRTKVTDRGDGTYMCEYRPWMTGMYSISINLDEDSIKGSPFSLNVITLRPDAAQCQVRGEALHKAVARLPQKFDVLFVDAMGHTAHAEDLDVWVTSGDPSMLTGRGQPPPPAAASSSQTSSQIKEEEQQVPAADASLEPAAPSPTQEGSVPSEPSSPPPSVDAPPAPQPSSETQPAPVDDVAPPPASDEPQKATPKVEEEMPREPEGSSSAADREIEEVFRDAPKTPKTPKSARIKKLDAPTRQRQLQLWAARQAADKFMTRRQADFRAAEAYGEDTKKRKKDRLEQSLPSFLHELSADKVGFAFGGVDPGTLHAHGKLIKVHHVSYSVGLAGNYKLHVALRQQMVELPGSPFNLCVEPGAAYAASTMIPKDTTTLTGSADEDWQTGLLLQTADMLGNMCVKGGANLTMALPKRWAQEHELEDPVRCRVNDRGDGYYELEWSSTLAGTFPLDVCIDGFHIVGSPIAVTVKPAKPDVNRFKASGAGLAKAIAGVEAPIRIRVADRFENSADAAAADTVFGLLLVPPAGMGIASKAEKKKTENADTSKQKEKKDGGDGKKKPAEKQADANAASKARVGGSSQQAMPESQNFSGVWVNGCYEIRYIADQAGTLDLNLWCVVDGTREPLPGSPFSIHVTEGTASHIGSSVDPAEKAGAGSDKAGQIVAGDHVVLKPQVRDQFNNPASAPEGSLTAVLDSPGLTGEKLEAPKLRSGLGSYELTLEPLKAGPHLVHVLLGGEEIKGSPVRFDVFPAAPNPSKCYLSRPDNEPILINETCEILLKTHDKYGNQLDRGGVRVDAKAVGVAASSCTVEDHKDGTYTIRMTAGAPTEVKVTARIDSVEIKTMSVFFTKASQDGAEGNDGRGTPSPDQRSEDGEELMDAAGAEPSSSAMPLGLPPLAVDKVVPTSVPPPAKEGPSSKDKKGKKNEKRRNSVKKEETPQAAAPAEAPASEEPEAEAAAPASEPTGGEEASAPAAAKPKGEKKAGKSGKTPPKGSKAKAKKKSTSE